MKKDILKDKKNLLIIGGIILAIIIIVLLVCFIFKKDTVISEETLEEELKKVGIDFYENYYYPGLGSDENKAKLAEFTETGIKIDLTNIELLVNLNEDIKTKLDKDSCDYDMTKIIIYPTKPYGQKDYKVDIELSCKK